jgi:hypothetical protein
MLRLLSVLEVYVLKQQFNRDRVPERRWPSGSVETPPQARVSPELLSPLIRPCLSGRSDNTSRWSDGLAGDPRAGSSKASDDTPAMLHVSPPHLRYRFAKSGGTLPHEEVAGWLYRSMSRMRQSTGWPNWA